MKLNFCTLFNSSYLSRGIVLYESLIKNSSNFHLYVFAFDDACYSYLSQQLLPNMTVISLKEFEDEELLKVKPTRSATEYCWTCTASTILYSIQKYRLDNCTYIDADMCFYSDPKVLIEEMGDHSVLITEHRYNKEYDQSIESGKYCVQFVTFKNTIDGMNVLNWWRNACIEWCYNRVEDGKFGDQKYLDNWTNQFSGVYELKHLGGGIAPWNVQQYKFEMDGSKLLGEERINKQKFEVVFYHFHSLKIFQDGIVMLGNNEYFLDKDVIELFYRPYVKMLVRASNEIKTSNPFINANGANSISPYKEMGLATIWKYYKNNLKSSKRNLLGKKLGKQIKNHSFFRISEFIK